jgi:hypothetical protein
MNAPRVRAAWGDVCVCVCAYAHVLLGEPTATHTRQEVGGSQAEGSLGKSLQPSLKTKLKVKRAGNE